MKSKVLQKDHEELALLAGKMTPEERLTAFFNHSRLVGEMYRAGLSHRADVPSKRKKDPRNT